MWTYVNQNYYQTKNQRTYKKFLKKEKEKKKKVQKQERRRPKLSFFVEKDCHEGRVWLICVVGRYIRCVADRSRHPGALSKTHSRIIRGKKKNATGRHGEGWIKGVEEYRVARPIIYDILYMQQRENKLSTLRTQAYTYSARRQF